LEDEGIMWRWNSASSWILSGHPTNILQYRHVVFNWTL